ncbi:MAG TPA: Asp-tRNA(Asn)/Glu-tRNA(Gln) amidotransferase subunit GatB [Polyangia bacterium]|nr:Asp-tRNA(Asn)/Glu-tRNA(Gln) amidotransferase subunit GatB [Polyangia bacterium]
MSSVTAPEDKEKGLSPADARLAKYEVVIGLEVHAQLSTKSKIFSWSSAAFGAEPNASTDPICLGMPGTLPVLNQAAVQAAVRLGLAVGSKIGQRCRFARKHYFYPDLPKGFQISQFDEPICEGGTIRFRVRGEPRAVKLVRIHMEEDAGKNVHASAGVSFVDYNRAGVPLCEIVSEPDVRSSEDAAEYVRALRTLVRYLGICDGNMEEGSMRCDANVSLRLRGDTKYGTKTEMKNMNSFKNVRDAIDHEVRRQATLLDRGDRVVQESRLWDATRGTSVAMRSKEGAHDYRYFPEPDLPPLMLSDVYIAAARDSLPELPEDRFTRYTTDGGLSQQDAGVLVAERDVADYFDAVVSAGAPSKKAANWVINEVLGRVDDVRRLSAADLPVPAKALAELIALVEAGTLSGKLGKEVFARMWSERRRAGDIVAAEGLAQVSDEGSIEEVCRKVVAANPSELGRYRGGEKKLLGFFVGAVMKETGGKANPKSANEILRRLLDEGQ